MNGEHEILPMEAECMKDLVMVKMARIVCVCSAPNDPFPFELHLISYSVGIVGNLMSIWMVWRLMVSKIDADCALEQRLHLKLLRSGENDGTAPPVTQDHEMNRTHSAEQLTVQMEDVSLLHLLLSLPPCDFSAPRCEWWNRMCSALHSFYTNSFSQTTEFRMQINVCFKQMRPATFPIFRHLFLSFLLFSSSLKWTRVHLVPTSNFNFNYTHFEFVLRRVSFTWK